MFNLQSYDNKPYILFVIYKYPRKNNKPLTFQMLLPEFNLDWKTCRFDWLNCIHRAMIEIT